MMLVMALMMMSMMALMMIKTMAMMTMEDTYLPAGICAGCAGDMNSCQGGDSSCDMNYSRVVPAIWEFFRVVLAETAPITGNTFQYKSNTPTSWEKSPQNHLRRLEIVFFPGHCY